MPRLIDADEFERRCMFSKEVHEKVDEDGLYAVLEELRMTPTVDAEPTEEQVKEYCRKRGFVIVNGELFNEMKARWSAGPGRHGRWLETGQSFVNPNKFRNYFCSECGLELDEHIRTKPTTCPNCKADMREEE